MEHEIEAEAAEEEEVGQQPPDLAAPEDEVGVEVHIEGRDDLRVKAAPVS